MANFIVRSSELYHVGNENSGRYPRGSGERPYQHKKHIRNEIERMNESTRDRLTQVINSDDYKNASSRVKQYVTDTSVDVTQYLDSARSDLKSLNKKQLYARLDHAIDYNTRIQKAALTIHVDGINKRWDDIATQHGIPSDVKNAVKTMAHDLYVNNKIGDSDTHTVAKYLNTLPIESHTDKFWSHIDAADKSDFLADIISDTVYDSKYIDEEPFYAYIDGWIR